MPGIEPVRDIAFRGHVGKTQDAHLGRDAGQRPPHRLTVLLAIGIVVEEEHDAPAAEGFGVVRQPLGGTHGVGRRHESEGGQTVAVFLTFGVQHPLVGIGGQEFGQAIEHPTHTLEIPDPVAIPVRLALGKALRCVAHRLIEQPAGFIAVGVGGGDPAVTSARVALSGMPVGMGRAAPTWAGEEVRVGPVVVERQPAGVFFAAASCIVAKAVARAADALPARHPLVSPANGAGIGCREALIRPDAPGHCAGSACASRMSCSTAASKLRK